MVCTSTVPPKNGAHFPTLGDEVDGKGGDKLSRRDIVDNWETECLRKGGRHVVISRTDGKSLGKVLPFEVEKLLNSAGEVAEITRKRDGTITALTKSLNQAETLMKTVKKISGHDVTIAFDEKRNRCRAVVRDPEMIHWDQEALLKYLAPQGVIAIQNIKARKKLSPQERHIVNQGKEGNSQITEEWIPTASFIITFNFPERPEILRIGYLDLLTRDYIPDPIRCFKCQRFGHLSTSCKNLAICVRCAKEEHSPDPCKSGPRCFNCGLAHFASWRSCPVFKEEKEIRKVMVEQRVPYHVARKIFTSFVKKDKTFAEVTTNRQTIGCSGCNCPCLSKAVPAENLETPTEKNTVTHHAEIHDNRIEIDEDDFACDPSGSGSAGILPPGTVPKDLEASTLESENNVSSKVSSFSVSSLDEMETTETEKEPQAETRPKRQAESSDSLEISEEEAAVGAKQLLYQTPQSKLEVSQPKKINKKAKKAKPTPYDKDAPTSASVTGSGKTLQKISLEDIEKVIGIGID